MKKKQLKSQNAKYKNGIHYKTSQIVFRYFGGPVLHNFSLNSLQNVLDPFVNTEICKKIKLMTITFWKEKCEVWFPKKYPLLGGLTKNLVKRRYSILE